MTVINVLDDVQGKTLLIHFLCLGLEIEIHYHDSEYSRGHLTVSWEGKLETEEAEEEDDATQVE